MTSIDPSGEPVFIIKVLRNDGSKLEDRKNYREINIKGNAWGRLFVHKDQVKEYGGLRRTTDYVRKVLSRIPVTDESEIKITFKHPYLKSKLKEDSRGIKSRPSSSSSSSSSPPISSSSSSSSSQVAAPTPDLDAKIASLLEAKRNLVLKNFNDQTLGFSKKKRKSIVRFHR
jgi:hypothetical protein